MAGIFRENLLAGKTALITGGSSGICFTIAERFAEHGAKVMLLGRRRETLDSACASIRSRAGTAEGFAADVRDYPAVALACARTRELFGPIDILVCGAAGNFPSAAAALSPNGFRAVVDIDLLGTFNTCRAACEHLKRPGASVLAISAIHSFTPIAFQAHVCAAKAGVDMLARVLALEWGREGVRVNALAPGPVDDTEGMRRLAPDDEARRRVTAGVPLGRFAGREEIADLALFLCSDAAGYITGTTIACDGGASLSGAAWLPHPGVEGNRPETDGG